MTHSASFLASAALLLVFPVLGRAQNAELSGRVKDPSDATIPNASVAVTNEGTGIRRTTSSNKDGLYTVPSLPPGSYKISVSAQGFQTVTRTGVKLEVEQRASLDFILPVGATTEVVTVEGGAPLVNSTDASVSTVVDQTYVKNMPLNGRSFQTLIALTPGVVLTPVPNANEMGQFSVNGQRADANYVAVDGASTSTFVQAGSLGQTAAGSLPGFSAFGSTNSLVSVDALQEFRIQTSSFAPEFGRTPGGQISITTRSGTNHFHGTVFNYLRNDIFDANDWFANNQGLQKPKERQNDFGGTLGGRILRDRTFFFFSYEGLRLRLPQTQVTNVPSNSARQSAIAAVQPFLKAFPVPNGTDFGNGLAQFNASYSDPSSLDASAIRLDHAISSKLNLFARYSYSPSDFGQRLLGDLSVTLHTHVASHTMTLGLTSVGQRIGNEFRLNYSNVRTDSNFSTDTLGGAAPISDSVAFPTGFSSANSLYGFQVGFASGSPQLSIGTNATGEQRQINLVDNVTFTKGSHSLKIGVDYRWLAPFARPLIYSQQNFFSSMAVTTSAAPVASNVLVGTKVPDALLIRNFSFFGQDAWKATSRMTLTYGLRWDVNPALKGKNSSNDPFTVTGLQSPATMTLAPRGTPLYETTYGNVAPRLGIAYQLTQRSNWETILRGGVGIFYDLGTGSLGNVTGGFPFTASNSLTNRPFPLSAQDAAAPSISLTPPVKTTLAIADPNLELPRTYEWNMALEQAIGLNQVLRATYVGSAGRELLRPYILSAPNAAFTSSISVTTNASSSNYQSLQLQFQRRMSKGLQALASYGWSHSIDNASHDSGFFTAPTITSQDIDRGDSDFDVRHNFAAAVTYDIPAPKGKIKRAVLGDWGLDNFFIARSALPVDVSVGTVIFGGTFFTRRPNAVPGVPLYLFGSQCTVLPGSGVRGARLSTRRRFKFLPPGSRVTLAGMFSEVFLRIS